MKKHNVILSVLLGALIVMTTLHASSNNTQEHTTCCAITVDYLGDDTAVVYYNDAVVPEHSYEIYVEVEYPEPDELNWSVLQGWNIQKVDVLQELIEETVTRMQGDCKKHHQ